MSTAAAGPNRFAPAAAKLVHLQTRRAYQVRLPARNRARAGAPALRAHTVAHHPHTKRQSRRVSSLGQRSAQVPLYRAPACELSPWSVKGAHATSAKLRWLSARPRRRLLGQRFAKRSFAWMAVREPLVPDGRLLQRNDGNPRGLDEKVAAWRCVMTHRASRRRTGTLTGRPVDASL